MSYLSVVADLLKEKRVAILGYGREGRSTCRFLLKHFPSMSFAVIDKNGSLATDVFLKSHTHINVFCGEKYLEALSGYDFVIKSPGISLKETGLFLENKELSSQTDIFLACFASQVIGITGTKGKSTTSSLIAAILKEAGLDMVFVGNIGMPPFDEIETIKSSTWVVYEMSSHQLDGISHSPHISVLLNIFEEHLDHYDSYEAYQSAKLNIATSQKKGDFFIYNADSSLILEKLKTVTLKGELLPFSLSKQLNQGIYVGDDQIILNDSNGNTHFLNKNFQRHLKGEHNLSNLLSVICISKLLHIEDTHILNAIACFKGLTHRLEYLGCFNGKHFYNDSIATIPEAAIAALKTLDAVDTLILGGYDRGVDYNELAGFLIASGINNIILIGHAGERIYKLVFEAVGKNIFFYKNFDAAVLKAVEVTAHKKTCLLSPAAASYGMFKDFEERGNRFKALIQK